MAINIGGQVEGLVIGGADCELGYEGCTNLGELREDPYQADVNNELVWIIACDECTQELVDAI